MKFSDVCDFENGVAMLSPSGKLIAWSSNKNVVVVNIITLETVTSTTYADHIAEFEWSPDSMFIACILKQRLSVEVGYMNFMCYCRLYLSKNWDAFAPLTKDCWELAVFPGQSTLNTS